METKGWISKELERLFKAPPLKSLPDEVADLRDLVQRHFADFRILRTTDTSYGDDVSVFATCLRCGDGVHFSGTTLWEALCLMLARVGRECPKDHVRRKTG